ncbi:FtsX-like permease family protein [uncultured Rikenella sp.]|uniref:ABC transporter permease n=1 Tax=uncultured Rikenella sp. TaxID=368003 RepID=UPI0025DB5CE4|nr:FtsX-like permease family protein [uncultured Rikenella sp.]
MSIPGVMAVSFAFAAPGVGAHNGYYGHFDTEGKLHDLRGFDGDTAFLTVLGIRPTQETGRRGPNGRQVWLTDAAWRDLELADDAIEYTRAENERHRFVITGRLRDFHIDDFSQQIAPVLVSLKPGYVGRKILIRVTGGLNFAAMDRIAEVYNRHAGGNYFNGRFLQQDIDNQYLTQQRMGEMVGVFALLAIVISALGMLAMATYFMRQREREVAVRKVFGSTSRQALTRVMAAFLKLVGVAFVVAVPVIGYLMRGWLAGYAYRIPLSWTIFVLAGAAALLIAGGSVLWQSWRTARANPVDVLRK